MHQNTPEQWLSKLPRPAPDGNKYDRGHAVVLGGGISSTGAARLAALSALRAGAGLVTVAAPSDALGVYASTLLAVMGAKVDHNFAEFIKDERKNTILIGPGSGISPRTKDAVIAALKSGKKCILDADALTCFEKEEQQLFSQIKQSESSCVLTPHEGEFARIFKMSGTREQRAAAAADQSGAVIVLKGPQTVIAAPNGDISVNDHAAPTLATAGSGDVLAGIITGLVAQNMPEFEAACAAVWIHGDMSIRFHRGLIADDMPGLIPRVLRRLSLLQ